MQKEALSEPLLPDESHNLLRSCHRFPLSKMTAHAGIETA